MAASDAGDGGGESTEVAAKRPSFMKASELVKSASASATGAANADRVSHGCSDIIEIDGLDEGWMACRQNPIVASSSSSSSSFLAASNMQKNSANQSRLGRGVLSITPGSRATSIISGQDLNKIHSKADNTSGSRHLPSSLFKKKI